MAWKSECVLIVRSMIDDLFTSPQKYADENLQQLILIAAQLANYEADGFNQVYTIDVDQVALSPDPTEGTKDDAFINLVCLKAACMLDMAEARKAGTQAFSFKEGTSAADLKGIADARIKFLKEGWCKAYAEALEDYMSTGNGLVAAAICTPFRVNGLTNAGSYVSYNNSYR